MPCPSGSRSSTPATSGDIARFLKRKWQSVERLCRNLISAIQSRRIGWSAIRTSRPSARAILANCSIGPASPEAGIGIWPPTNPPSAGSADRSRPIDSTISRLIGYCASVESQTPALVAFQRRFRQSCCDGRLDLETAARLAEVSAAFARSRAVLRGSESIKPCSPSRLAVHARIASATISETASCRVHAARQKSLVIETP